MTSLSLNEVLHCQSLSKLLMDSVRDSREEEKTRTVASHTEEEERRMAGMANPKSLWGEKS